MTTRIFVGDKVKFTFTIMEDDGATPVDLSAENNLLLIFNCITSNPPVRFTATPTKVVGGDNNVLQYTTIPVTDLSVDGKWEVQLETETTNLPGHSTIAKFKVEKNLIKPTI